jgi:deazaflavin-dependent oxidoreductase (nitroreductase family)
MLTASTPASRGWPHCDGGSLEATAVVVEEEAMGKFFMRVFTTLHGKIVKATGKLGGGTKDGSVLVLRHTGAKTGKQRETPLMFVNHDGAYVVCASMGGAPEHPGWYFNLKANPDVTATVDRRSVLVRARELAADERSEVWGRFKAMDKRWEQYETSTDRVMPLIALEPR